MSGEGQGQGERRPLLADEPGRASGSQDTFGRRLSGLHNRTQSENQNQGGNGEEKEEMSWREWMGETLESPRTHKVVLTLVRFLCSRLSCFGGQEAWEGLGADAERFLFLQQC